MRPDQLDRAKRNVRDAVARRGPDGPVVVRRVTRNGARQADDLLAALADGRIDGAAQSRLTRPTVGVPTECYFMLDVSTIDGDDVLE